MQQQTGDQGKAVQTDWDDELLTRPDGGLGWERLSRLAEALANEPGGWERVADVTEESVTKDVEDGGGMDDAAWLRGPYMLAEIGRFVDDPDRRKIAGCLVELLLDTDPRDDFLIETLTEAIGLLGPAALPEVVAGLSMSRPDDGGWIALLYLLELGGDRSATTSQQALAVEAAERVLRRVEAGEISASDGGGASMVLAMLGHQPSIGLIERIAQREDQGPMAVWGINEHASALKRLRGEEGRDKREPSPPRWKRPSAELAEGAWRAFAKWRDDYEQQRQSEFNRMCAQLYAAPPLALPAPRIPDPAHAHPPQRTGFANVSRNAKCPCGSGKKYKKCCGPKRR